MDIRKEYFDILAGQSPFYTFKIQLLTQESWAKTHLKDRECSCILKSSEQFYCSVLAEEMTELSDRCHEFLVALNPMGKDKNKLL